MREEPQLGAEPSLKTHEDYTVGWICALSIELTAAAAMLDVKHRDLKTPANDQNVYSLGSIGEHNIVIATLATIGTNNAAAVAAQMIITFPNIKFGLMVGIGAGIPPKVRLGDVVVSRPSGTYPGVVQWDYGKATGDGFQRTGVLNNPPNLLLAALKKLETENEMHGSKIPYYLQQLEQRYPRLASQYLKSASLEDIAFKSDVPHVDKANAVLEGLVVPVEDEEDEEAEEEEEKACQFCDKKRSFKTSKREMLVHFGLIASGNQVIKDAKARNQLKNEIPSLLCIEMEAAGLMNLFPCLVIRGICDYADAHKNKDWQRHAAAVAAAFTKELLFYIQVHQVDKEPPVIDVLRQVRDEVSEIVTYTRRAKANWDQIENRQILSWLTDTDYGSIHADKISQKHPGTGEWFLKSAQFQQWCNDGKIQTLFCLGAPGAGKTVIAATAISELLAMYGSDDKIGISYIYFNFKPLEPYKVDNLLAGLLKQLTQKLPHVPNEVKELYERHRRNNSRPTTGEYQSTLLSIASNYSKVFILLDALDECNHDCLQSFLDEIFSFQDGAQTKEIITKVFATSRHIPAIKDRFTEASILEISGNDDDMHKYMQEKLPHLNGFLKGYPMLWEEIKRETIKAAEGIFLLVRLQLEALEGAISPNQVRAILKSGNGRGTIYEKTYDKIMNRIRAQGDLAFGHAISTLSWIVGSKRPLKILEFRHALAIKLGQSEMDEGDLPDLGILQSFCHGLVLIDKKTDLVRLVHFTAQEYFMDPKKQHEWLPNLQITLAESCITYLKYKNFQTGACIEESDLKARRERNPLFDYAALNWGHHVHEAGIGAEPLALGFIKTDALMSACSQGLFYMWPRKIPCWINLCAYYGLSNSIESVLSEQYGLHKAVDLEVKDRFGRTPLSLTAKVGHTAVVELLIGKGANLEAKDRFGHTPLLLTAEAGHTTVVELLIGKGANLEAKDDFFKRTPLLWAAKAGHTTVVELLIGNGAYLEAKDRHGQTPLLLTTEARHTTVVELLIGKGANLEAKDDYFKQTPLLWAAKAGHTTVVELLIGNGADLEAKDRYGQTPLVWAVKNGYTAIVKLLESKGAKPQMKNEDGTVRRR